MVSERVESAENISFVARTGCYALLFGLLAFALGFKLSESAYLGFDISYNGEDLWDKSSHGCGECSGVCSI